MPCLKKRICSFRTLVEILQRRTKTRKARIVFFKQKKNIQLQRRQRKPHGIPEPKNVLSSWIQQDLYHPLICLVDFVNSSLSCQLFSPKNRGFKAASPRLSQGWRNVPINAKFVLSTRYKCQCLYHVWSSWSAPFWRLIKMSLIFSVLWAITLWWQSWKHSMAYVMMYDVTWGLWGINRMGSYQQPWARCVQ